LFGRFALFSLSLQTKRTKNKKIMYDKERGFYIAHCPKGALSITGKMANRHGLIAGATGTG
jgi:hypothetical protein